MHQIPVAVNMNDSWFFSRIPFHLRSAIQGFRDGPCTAIAEGLETVDQMSRIISLRCEYGQGFLFSEAVGSREAEAFIDGKSF